MERQFRDEYRESDGFLELSRLWLRMIGDLVTSVPKELFRELSLDLKHSIRIYRKRPLATALAVIALGLAIGSSTGVFSVLNALLLRSLPFESPSQLVEMVAPSMTAMAGRSAFTKWYRECPYLESAATFSTSDMNVTADRDALRVKVAETSANLFHLLGVKPVLGRAFSSDEDIWGHNAIAVISYGLWQQVFAGEPGVIGRTLRVNGSVLTVIGVAPPNFDYPGKAAIWLPTVFDFEKVPKRGAFFFQTIGRLKRGISIQVANEFFQAEARHTKHAGRETVSIGDRNWPHLVSLQNQLAGPVQRASLVLALMTLLVVVTACANVAQLLLSRATERRQELAVRAALGASRARLVQQLVTEASVLTLMGACLGLLVAYWASRMASSVAPAQLGTQEYTILDWRVLCFATFLALLMGLVVGVFPAWLIGRLQPSGHLVRNQPGMRDLGTNRARSGLLFIQATLALCLITSSLTMGRTFLQLINTNLGFRPTNVVTLNVSVQGAGYKGPREWAYYEHALNQLRSVPGVQAAGAVGHLPLANNFYMAFPFKMDSGQTLKSIVVNSITNGYFQAMKTPLLAGRDFAENEMRHSEPSVIVNEAFAQSTKLGRAIVGRHLTAPWSNTPYRIVGVVATVRAAGPANAGGPEIYWPIEEEPPPALTLVARVDGSAEPYLARSRDAVQTVDRSIPVYDVKTIEQRLADVLARPKFYTTATLFLALLAVLLAAVGIFGTAAYSIAQRRHEMGVRMAVGASYQRIRNMIVRESMGPIIYGTIAGMVFAFASGRYTEHLLENASAPGALITITAAGLLLLAGLVAAWSATGRVLAIDPLDAIRAE
ncbi:MAG TPA: ADOP family duplicated permease [Bryobacteraceae bacterium]|nr:ADOP family duplicated permease [Bryobacteraceae bacterium]